MKKVAVVLDGMGLQPTSAIISALAREGYAIVPVEPTDEMHEAFYADRKGNFLTRYAAMIAVAKLES